MDMTPGPDGALYVIQPEWVRVVRGDRVETLAGGGHSSADGPVGSVGFSGLSAIAVAVDGRIFVAQPTRVRVVHDGQVETVAGAAQGGYIDGAALEARFTSIRDIALAADGSMLIADGLRIRRLKDGAVSTIAGSGETGETKIQDGPALEARIGSAHALEIVGNRVYFTDTMTVRVLENDQVTTLAGAAWSGAAPPLRDGPAAKAVFSSDLRAVAVHGEAVYVSDASPSNNRIRVITAGQVSSLTNGVQGLEDGPLSQARFDSPGALVADDHGNLYVSDVNNCRVRWIELH